MKFIILIFIIIGLSFFLLRKKEEFLSPAVLEIQFDENQEKYLNFQKLQNKILEDTQFQIGYKETDNTDIKTVGLCPLGQFYKGDVPETVSPNDVSKCVPCTKCYPGYYLKEGCSGNVDSVCEPLKVPHEIFLRAHGENKILHNLINPHQHPYGFEIEENVGQIFKMSSLNHNHV